MQSGKSDRSSEAPTTASISQVQNVLAVALKWQIWGVVVSAQVSTEQAAQTYLLPLFFLLSHSECCQKQLSHTSSKMLELSPSPMSPAPSQASRALSSQIAWELLPPLSTMYSPGSSSLGGLVTQEGTNRTDAAQKNNDAGSCRA